MTVLNWDMKSISLVFPIRCSNVLGIQTKLLFLTSNIYTALQRTFCDVLTKLFEAKMLKETYRLVWHFSNLQHTSVFKRNIVSRIMSVKWKYYNFIKTMMHLHTKGLKRHELNNRIKGMFQLKRF
jgi:hypothetical protein